MLVSDSPMLGFRALQAIMDLRATAGRQPRSAIKGIAAHIPPTDRKRGADSQALTRLILHQGGRLETAEDLPLLDALQFAATQPQADPTAFAAATAVLLADRLQHGLGRENMGLYWESFHPAYYALPHHDRAAIVQGFMAGARTGQVKLGAPLPKLAHVTASEEAVRAKLLALVRRKKDLLISAVVEAVGEQMSALVLPQLRMSMVDAAQQPLTGDSPLFEPLLMMASNTTSPAGIPATALLLATAVQTGDEEGWFSITLWAEMLDTWLSLDEAQGRAILGGLRHLYESDQGWSPMPDRRVNPRQMGNAAFLPVLDASFTGGQHGARVG